MQADSSNNTIIYLIRHAETYNPKRIIYVRLPGFDLSRLGFFQAQKLHQFFKSTKIDSVYCSPLLRSRRTAEIIAAKKLPINKRENLTEIGFTKWQGLTYEERTIREIEQYIKAPETIDYLGESLEEAQVRMISEIYKILRKNIGKSVAIVSHADPIILSILYFRGKPLSALNNTTNPNASIYKLVFNKALECEKIEYTQVAPAKKDWP